MKNRGRCQHAHSRPRSTLPPPRPKRAARSEEHTSELQSLAYLVCRLLLEKKNLNKMPGLIREARDMHGIKEATRKRGQAKPDAPPAAPGEPAAERGPRKKG